MLIFLQNCMTELSLPRTECWPALRFQQGQKDSFVLWQRARKDRQPGESLPETCCILWTLNFPEFSSGPFE